MAAIRAARQPRRPQLSWLAIAWLAAVLLVAVTADLLPFIQDPYQTHPFEALAPISAEHWLGTDKLGRDVLARLAYGARASLIVGLGTVVVCFAIGGTIGMLAGYRGGKRDAATLLATDVLMSVPGLVIAIAIVAFLGQSMMNVVFALSVIVLPGVIRVARANTLAVTQREFVVAARTAGARDRRIIFREVLPNVASPLLSLGLIVIGAVVLAEGSLSFVGLGVPAPQPTWGGMVAGGRSVLDTDPQISLFPATVLFITVLALNSVGSRVRTWFDSRGGAL